MKPLKIFIALISVVVLQSCIHNPEKEDCFVKEIEVVKISEGGVKDLVLHDAEGNFFYINRGLENGFTMENATEAILNKIATLHIAESWQGKDSKHIAQLEVDGNVIYTEFGDGLTVNLNH
ncbi:hypothetical protein [Marinirhabdus gelatinilytica]|uniref:Uncharacterized protein n=1 Tax=Marinirhabdus gelatinilytica TaxID=1703343 RepID=A0A370QKF9_9FLAO|nr:hypothetical protein [Marinirhabdus gelatinilytica]RDK88826.1 hypothetical protein C8D94_101703 [Marinirhabdus gelatinilytica]